jgi:hypothetical protein
MFFGYFLLRVLLRKPWAAAVLYILLFSLQGRLSGPAAVFQVVVNVVLGAAVILILTRFGLLPMITGMLVSSILPAFPMTTDFSAWYAGSTIFAIAAVILLTAFAFHTARAGRPIFGEGILDR